MVSRDAPWSGGVCRTAAWCGHLEVLKWAVANGCPGFSERWFELCIDAAELNGHDHVLEWLAEQAEAGNIPPPGPEDEYLD